MKKKVLAVVMVLLLCITATACRGKVEYTVGGNTETLEFGNNKGEGTDTNVESDKDKTSNLESVNENTDMANSIVDYINNDLVEVLELESEYLDYYDAVTGENFSNDGDFYVALIDNILPAISKLVEVSESIEPEVKEIADIHNTYIDAVKTQTEALMILMKALEESNVDGVTEANLKMQTANNSRALFEEELVKLAEEYNVEISY